MTKTESEVPGPTRRVTLHPDNTYSAAPASSSSCRSPTSPREERDAQRDLQPDADRSRPVLRGHGQRRLRRRRDGAGTRLHPQLRDEQRQRPPQPLLRDVQLDRHGVHRRRRSRGTSRARTTSTTTATARSASPRRWTSACRRPRRTAIPTKKPNQGGFCAKVSGLTLSWTEHERDDLDVDRDACRFP